jgi:hypothetical protein
LEQGALLNKWNILPIVESIRVCRYFCISGVVPLLSSYNYNFYQTLQSTSVWTSPIYLPSQKHSSLILSSLLFFHVLICLPIGRFRVQFRVPASFSTKVPNFHETRSEHVTSDRTTSHHVHVLLNFRTSPIPTWQVYKLLKDAQHQRH